jgi:hypothetical protein
MTGQTKPRKWPADAVAILSTAASREGAEYSGALGTFLDAAEMPARIERILSDETPERQRPDAWARLIADHPSRDAFVVSAYYPDQALAGSPLKDGHDGRPRWSTLVDLYTAWSQVAAAGQFSIIDERSSTIALAYFARTRWLLLSLPFRPGWEGTIPADLDMERINAESSRILTLARQARDDWLTVLTQIDDYPTLKQDIDIEEEAAVIARLEITRSRLATANPGLNLAPSAAAGTGGPDRAADPDHAGISATEYVVTRLLLPRFAIGRTWRIIYGTVSWQSRVAGGLAALAGAASLILLLIGLADPAGGLLGAVPVAAICWYALIALASTFCPRSAWPWLMRQPASAAVALLALALAPPDWWHNSGHQQHVAVWAALLLTAVGIGYLYMQAGNQDVRGVRRLWRPAVVAASGFLHAAMVTVIGLRYVLPEFAPRPAQAPDLSCWWHAAGCGPDALHPWLLIFVAAAWSFAAGVFLQIIWDDQPVTAPLAHVSWRRGS